MALNQSPSIVTNGLVMYYDMNNTDKSWKGSPTTNYVSNASTMSGWNNYSNTANGTPAQFITEFGTTGYNMDFVGSWNGIYKGVTVPSTGTYTFSAWIKWIGGSNNVTGGAVYISGWGGGDSASATNRTLPGQWQRISITLNCTTTSMTFYLICWGGTNNADNSSWQVTMPQIESGSFATPFVDGTRYTNNNLEPNPSWPTWNQSASSASGGTLTFTSGSYNSKGTWDLYKTYSGLSTGVNYTWSALVKAGTATNLIATMNNTSAWNTGPSALFGGFSATEWKRVSITGTTSTGSFNLHLGASANTEMLATVQSGGTLLIQDVRLQLTGSQTAIQDSTDQSTVTPGGLVYNSDGTFNLSSSNPSYIQVPLASAFNKLTGSINVWIYPTSYNGGNGIFVNRTDATANAVDWLWIGPYGGNFYFRIGSGGDCCSNDNSFSGYYSLVPVNTWNNICCTWSSGGTSCIYINGSLYQSRSISTIPNTNPDTNGRFGLGHAYNDSYFNGKMPIAQIYNRQLTDAEVRQNFNAIRGRYGI